MKKRAAVIILMGLVAAGTLSGCRESDVFSDPAYSSEVEETEETESEGTKEVHELDKDVILYE